MEGLCQMIGGDAWAVTMVHFPADLAPRQVLMMHGGFTETSLAKWAEAIEHPCMKPVTEIIANQAMTTDHGFTRRCADSTPPAWWDSDDPAFLLWTEAGLRSFILSAWPIEDEGFGGIGIYRETGRHRFTARECRIAHIILSEIPWLHHRTYTEGERHSLIRLAPRLRTVLNLLVSGHSRGDVAKNLGITVNTIHGYTKEIFRHFQVNSQAELVSRFTKGDGRDLP